MESLRWLIDLARRAGVARTILNGSFTTEVAKPNDVDCLLLMGPDFPKDRDAETELLGGLPFLLIDLVRQRDFDVMVEKVFATDRVSVPKGMIEVIQWN